MDTNTTFIVLTAIVIVFSVGVYANVLKEYDRKYRRTR